MRIIIAAVRLILILTITIFSFFITLLLFPIIPRKSQIYIVKNWAKINLYCLGITIEIEGNLNSNYIRHNAMLIANHISWTDIVVLYTIYSVGFIGRAEMQNWPILKSLIKAGGTIFIDRSKKRELFKINHHVSSKLTNGATVGLFPEGKTSDGNIVLPFKAPILESAILANSTIIPLVINYYRKDNTRAIEVSYWGETTLWQTLTRILLLNGIKAKVTLLPEFPAQNFTLREDLAAYLHNQISQSYNKKLDNPHIKNC